MNTQIAISALVPVYNRLTLAGRCLSALADQDTDFAYQIVVVDDGSSPPIKGHLPALVGKENFRFLQQANTGRGSAINKAVVSADADVVVICDADIIPTRRFLRDHLQYHRTHREKSATFLGYVSFDNSSRTNYDLIVGPRGGGAVSEPLLDLEWDQWLTDNWSCKRELLLDYRFDSGFKHWGWEDTELAYRLARSGVTCRMASEEVALGYHLKRFSAESTRSKYQASVPNLLYFASKHPEIVSEVDWFRHKAADMHTIDICETIMNSVWDLVQDLMSDYSIFFCRSDIISKTFRSRLFNGDFSIGLARGFLTEGLDEQDDSTYMVQRIVDTVIYVALIGIWLTDRREYLSWAYELCSPLLPETEFDDKARWWAKTIDTWQLTQ